MFYLNEKSPWVKMTMLTSVITQQSTQHEADNETKIEIISTLAIKNISFSASVANTTIQSSVMDVDAAETRKITRILLYMYAVPALWALCFIAALANFYILIGASFLTRRVTNVLWVTFSLATADLWASIVIAVGLLINSYLPIVKGIKFTSCIGLSLEAFRLGSVMSSVLHLLLLAMVHHMATVCPLTYCRKLKLSIDAQNFLAFFFVGTCIPNFDFENY